MAYLAFITAAMMAGLCGMTTAAHAERTVSRTQPSAESPFQDRTERLRILDGKIGTLKGALERYRNDLRDFQAIAQVWDEMRKQFQTYLGAAGQALKSCAEHDDKIKKLQKTHPAHAERFRVTTDECRDVGRTTDRLIAEYEVAFTRIAKQIDTIRNLSDMTSAASLTSEVQLKTREEEKRMIENLKKLPGMSGYAGAITPDSFKGY